MVHSSAGKNLSFLTLGRESNIESELVGVLIHHLVESHTQDYLCDVQATVSFRVCSAELCLWDFGERTVEQVKTLGPRGGWYLL